jgi:carnitine O-acetyltransferase
MNSFFFLCPSRFHASRYPAIPKDTAHKFDPATHNHVVFIRNNRFFEVQLAYPDGTELSVADLEAYESTCIFFFLNKD